MRTTQPLSKVKARLSEVVRRVRETQEPLVITVGGLPVAEIRAIRPVAPRLSAKEVALVKSLTDLVRRSTKRRRFDAVKLIREGRR
jgi:prevent-host-death family protein